MKKGSYMDVRLLAALTGLLLVGMAYVALRLHREGQRHQVQTTSTMARTRQLFEARADALFHSMGESVMQEAYAIQSHPVLDTAMAVQRWRVVLAAQWPVLGISLADGKGNALILQRAEKALALQTRQVSEQRTRSTEQPVPTALEAPITAPPVQLPPLPDPRSELWMSRAMENHRDVPVWSAAARTPENIPGLRVSYRLRPPHTPLSDLVLSFHLAVDRSIWLAANALQQRTVAFFLTTEDGRMLTRPAPGHWSAPVIPKALEMWKESGDRGQFPVEMDDRVHWFQSSPYELNGRSLRMGTLVNHDLAALAQRPERRTLRTVMALLAVGLGLCLWLGLRRSQEIDRLRRQERRSRSQELRLVKALGEREVLNREVHHRVKNNLQIVSSLLNLQASRLDDGPVRDEFLRGKLRIDTMALVHHKLYALTDLREVDLLLFIRSTMEALAGMYVPESRTVSHEVDTGGLHVDQDTAISLGIILCELVGNAFQHAFPYATGGHIEVMVRPVEGDLYRLVVKDNGSGMGASPRRENHLGLEIVEALADQLDGSVHTGTGTGTTVEVLFRIGAHAPR